MQLQSSLNRRLTIKTMNKTDLILVPPSAVFPMRAQKEASRPQTMETPSRRKFKDTSSALLLSRCPPESAAFMSPVLTSRPSHFMTTPPSIHRRSTSKRMRRSEFCNDDGEVFPHLHIPIFDDFFVLNASEETTRTGSSILAPPRVPYKLSIRPQRLSESNWSLPDDGMDSFAPVEDSSTESTSQCFTKFQQMNVHPIDRRGKISRRHSGGNAVAA